MDEEERIYRKVESIVRQDNRSTYIGEDDLVRLTQRGITVTFHLKHEKLDVINLLRTIKRTQKIIGEKLGYTLDDIRVNIYRSGAEVLRDGGRRNPYASWAAGYFDGEITIVSEEDDEEEAKSLFIYLTHEIIHCAVHEITGGRCPFWLDEGLSVFLSQELPDGYLESLHDALETGSLLPLRGLENPDDRILDDEEQRRIAYAEAACMVECLVVSPFHGWERVKGLLRNLKKEDMDGALLEQCLSYDLIQSDMEKWAKKKIGEIIPADRRIL
ncbi:MAG TPA: hypothetical protein VGJ94_13160 [Syntrophorhabdaceae bacterium]|jgi:hypothetical protein